MQKHAIKLPHARCNALSAADPTREDAVHGAPPDPPCPVPRPADGGLHRPIASSVVIVLIQCDPHLPREREQRGAEQAKRLPAESAEEVLDSLLGGDESVRSCAIRHPAP
jgi:hypothetical protein